MKDDNVFTIGEIKRKMDDNHYSEVLTRGVGCWTSQSAQDSPLAYSTSHSRLTSLLVLLVVVFTGKHAAICICICISIVKGFKAESCASKSFPLLLPPHLA